MNLIIILILFCCLLIDSKGDHPTAPQSVEELVLSPEKTNSQEEFVLYESGPGKKHRTIMFASATTLNFLEKCEIMFMDGTVKSCPLLFDQLYVIHGQYNCMTLI